MAESVAGISLPEGDPGAISDAAARLAGMAAVFDGASQTVGGAVSQVGTWQGAAAEGFRGLAAGYERVGALAADSLRDAAASVRRYEAQFEEAYEAVKRLQREARECVNEIELWERRRADAAEREASARARAAEPGAGAGLDLGGGALAARAAALRDADVAATERSRAERRLSSLRTELDDLRRRAEVEREQAQQAEFRAAVQVASAESSLATAQPPVARAAPAVPAVYRGGASTRLIEFDLGDILEFSREVDRKAGPVDDAISDGVEKIKPPLEAGAKLLFDPGAAIEGIRALFSGDLKRAADKLTDGIGGGKSKGLKKLAKGAIDKLKGLLPSRRSPSKTPKPPPRSQSPPSRKPPTPDELVRPRGTPIGRPGTTPGIREVPSAKDLDELFEQLRKHGTPTKSRYPGSGYDLPGGGFVGRRESKRFGPTLDINIPGVPDVKKVHVSGK